MVPFHNFEEPLEGYAAHLTHIASGRHYAPRPSGLAMHDLREVDVQDMQRWTERILEAIHLGKVVDNEGNDVILDEDTGADIIGSLIESSYDSKNIQFYGNLHNWGHVMMAYIHDPDGRFRVSKIGKKYEWDKGAILSKMLFLWHLVTFESNYYSVSFVELSV